MKKFTVCLALLGLLALGGQAFAELCTIDAVPAATLLLPYFEVSLASDTGQNTLFSINNASATAVLAHVTFWTDQSVPSLDFDVYLTGYDVQTLSIRDILVLGNLPRTASVGQDPGDTISPQGIFSQDINFASCTGTLPYTNPAISPSFRAHLQAWHQGLQSPATGNCAGFEYGDGLLRGYVTVDTVNACNLLFPSSPGYFEAFTTNQNVLWGDYFYVNPTENFAQGETLVHVEGADLFFVPGDHTFYGRYVAATAIDDREPLGTTYASRFINGGAFTGGTDLAVWREGNAAASGYSCALSGPSSWFPLEALQIVTFDEQENPFQVEQCPSGDPTCEQVVVIPNEAQRVDVVTDLGSTFNFGWIYLNLQHPDIIPGYGDDDAQAWVTTIMDADGRFSVGFDAIQLDSACNATTFIVGGGGSD